MSTSLMAMSLSWLILMTLYLRGRLRTLPFEFTTRPARLIAWLLLWGIVYAGIVLPATMATQQLSLDIDDIRFSSLFASHATLLAFLILWWKLRRPIRLTRFLFLDSTRGSDFAAGALLGLRIWGVTLGAALVLGSLFQLVVDGMAEGVAPPISAPQIPDIMPWLADLPIAKKLLLIASAMTVEEAFFRAFLQSRIGLLPSSLLFAMAHASYGLPTLMIGVFIVSIMIGRDFAKHQSLARAIIAHGVFDAIQLIVVVPFTLRQLQSLS